MHSLEHILLLTSLGVKYDEISKAELVRVLTKLASESHFFEPPKGDDRLKELDAAWSHRFANLVQQGGLT